jgi:hypothetical protein
MPDLPNEFLPYFALQLNADLMKGRSLQKVILLFSVVLVTSCQKELSIDLGSQNGGGGGTGTNRNIVGDWNFVGMTATTNSTVTVSSPLGELKSITVSGYITKNNAGTVKITSSDFITTGLGYSIDTTMNVKTYMNGLLLDNTDMPFALDSPPVSNTSPYTRINADSITVTGAFGAPNPSGATPTGPVGIRIAWSGDTLLLKVASSFTQSISQAGVPGTLVGSVTGITKLKRR